MRVQSTIVLALLSVLAMVSHLWGLKCRGDDDGSDDEEFREAVRTCRNGDFRWNPESDGEEAGFKYSQYGRRSHRARESRSEKNARNPRDAQSNGPDYQVYGHTDSTRTDTERPLENMEACAVLCIFRQLGMLDREDMPDKGIMTYVMSRNVREPRVKWFVEDSVDECFELFRPEDRDGRCDFAKNLGLCLQEKGRRTCEDWDQDNHQNKQNDHQNDHHQNKNNNHRSH